MRALVAVLSLIFTPVAFTHADPIFDGSSLFGFQLNMDHHRRYEAKFNASVAALHEYFQLNESSRVVVVLQEGADKLRGYIVEVKFCLKSNANVCLDETLKRHFLLSGDRREAKHEFSLYMLSAETLKAMANLARRDELVMVTSVESPRTLWWNEFHGSHIINFNDLLRLQSLDTIVPTERSVRVKLRFEPTREY